MPLHELIVRYKLEITPRLAVPKRGSLLIAESA
jgi:hypothetical protein